MDEPFTVGGTEYLDMRRPAWPSPDWPMTALFFVAVIAFLGFVALVGLVFAGAIALIASLLLGVAYNEVWNACGMTLWVIVGVIILAACCVFVFRSWSHMLFEDTRTLR